MMRQVTQLRQGFIRKIARLVRVHAHGCAHLGELFSQGHGPAAAGQVYAGYQHAPHTRLQRSPQYCLPVGIKYVQVQMAVRVNKSGNC